MKNQKLKLIYDVKKQVGKDKIICASGGSIVVWLLNYLIKLLVNLYCIFVNTGLLRKMKKASKYF